MRIAIATTTLLALVIGLPTAMAQTSGTGTTDTSRPSTTRSTTSDNQTPPLKGAW